MQPGCIGHRCLNAVVSQRGNFLLAKNFRRCIIKFTMSKYINFCIILKKLKYTFLYYSIHNDYYSKLLELMLLDPIRCVRFARALNSLCHEMGLRPYGFKTENS